MSERSSGKIAVVTGAGRGLGRHVALGLAAHDYRVVLVSRTAEQLRETARLIDRAGGSAAVMPADVSDTDSVEKLAAVVARDLGKPSVLINAAGIFGPIQLIKDADPREWIQTIRVNLLGPYLTCRAFAGGMIDQGWGRIVNFSSAAALHPPGPLNSAYATSKVALNQFTRQLACELAGTGVTANVIHPGDVKTEMWAQIRDQSSRAGPNAEGYRQWVQWVEQTGGDDPQKAVELVLRLTGEQAAETTGQFLWIDGGLQPPVPSWDAPVDARPWGEATRQ